MKAMDIKRERRREWVAALRSGEYKQTKLVLQDGKGFCCLGVACDKSGLGEWADLPSGSSMVYRTYDGQQPSGSLPLAVADYYGINSVTGVFYVAGESYTLARCNDDGETLTFDQIADVIDWIAETS